MNCSVDLVARRLLCAHSSPVTGRTLRGLLLITYHPVSEVWEPVVFNRYRIRLRALPASSDFRVWLTVICHWSPLAALRWVWSTRPACVSWTSQQSEFFGRRSQLLFPPKLKCHGASVSGQKLQALHRWFRRGRTCAQPRAEDQRPRRRTAPRS